jgi:hypothetical protein
MKKIFFVLSLCLFLVSTGFAGIVRYNTKAGGGNQSGYYENMLQTDMYEVQFIARTWFYAKRYCMLRCANLCLENGYKSFNILFNETSIVQECFGVYMNIECFRDDSGKYKAEEIKTNLFKLFNIKEEAN